VPGSLKKQSQNFHHRADFANNSKMVTDGKKATLAKDTGDAENINRR
jgi:hypothetical protein